MDRRKPGSDAVDELVSELPAMALSFEVWLTRTTI